MTRLGKLTALATKMELDPLQAIALPTVIIVVAEKVSMTEDMTIAWAMEDDKARAYMKEVIEGIDIAGALEVVA